MKRINQCVEFYFKRIENNISTNMKGSGFFCELDENFPIKYALFMNNHVLDESWYRNK